MDGGPVLGCWSLYHLRQWAQKNPIAYTDDLRGKAKAVRDEKNA